MILLQASHPIVDKDGRPGLSFHLAWQKLTAAASMNTVSKTAAYPMTGEEAVILCDATSGAFTVTLPDAASSTDREFVVKKVDASVNAVTVDGNGSETIDGAANVSLAAQWDKVRVVSDGSNWLKT